MKLLCFAPDHNTPGTNPHTGNPWQDAREFQAQMAEFVTYRRSCKDEVDSRTFDNSLSMPERMKSVLAAIRGCSGLDGIFFFCHGWRAGFQAGLHIADVPAFAEAIAKASKAGCHLRMVFYACSLGGDAPGAEPGMAGEGDFLDVLRDKLVDNDDVARVTLFGHTVDGHTTRNPRLRVFDSSDAHTTTGGRWVVKPPPQGHPRFDEWRAKLAKRPDIRFGFWQRYDGTAESVLDA